MPTRTFSIIPITPLHIGNGTTYGKMDYFFDEKNKSICLYDDKKLLDKLKPEQIDKIFKSNRDFRFYERIYDNIIETFHLNKYDFILKRIHTRENPQNNNIEEFIKNGMNKIYVPGSSVKGAIRTALIYEFLKESQFSKKFKHQLNMRIGGYKQFFNHIKELFFSSIPIKNPSEDIFKKIRITDSKSYSPEDYCLIQKVNQVKIPPPQKENFRLLNRKQEIFLETIPEQKRIEDLTIHIDTKFIFDKTVQNRLKWNKYKSFFEFLSCLQDRNPTITLLKKVQLFYLDFIENELNIFKKHNLKILATFYEELKTRIKNLKDNEFIFRLGKTTGFLDKTVMGLIKFDYTDEYFSILKKLLPRSVKIFKYEFPITRWKTSLNINQKKIDVPLGWVKLMLKK
ncbi:MAG: type III-A CRISPR-associated RAMP protein Csm5 [Candidatus Helarchaeota archaeon]